VKGRAVIIRTETSIAPFNEHVSLAFFSGETLAESQDRAFAAIGFEVVRVAGVEEAIAKAQSGPALLMLDRVYVSEKALRDFIAACKKASGPSALALSKNVSVEYTLPLQDVRDGGERVVHDVVWVPKSESGLPSGGAEDPVAWMHALRDRAAPVEVPKREIAVEVQLPVIGEQTRTTMQYPITSTIVVSIEHWVHVLWLNQIAFGIRWMELIGRRPIWAFLRAVGAWSIDRDRIIAHMVSKGRGTKIHPTATVASSILGRDVQVGPHVTVRNSIIGDGAILQDHAVILNSVIGGRCLITENTVLVSCASYPEATIGNYKLQVSLIGRGAYVNVWAGFIDAKFRGTVQVSHRGALASTERAFLGSVVGHRAKVAAKILIQPGREIPNDAWIVMRPDEVVSEIPRDLPAGRPLVRDRGTLVPLGEESRTP
jgi:carbonic anhydrase/acetyltransferase-like protein (isoleucine patch superfamily)